MSISRWIVRDQYNRSVFDRSNSVLDSKYSSLAPIDRNKARHRRFCGAIRRHSQLGRINDRSGVRVGAGLHNPVHRMELVSHTIAYGSSHRSWIRIHSTPLTSTQTQIPHRPTRRHRHPISQGLDTDTSLANTQTQTLHWLTPKYRQSIGRNPDTDTDTPLAGTGHRHPIG